MIYTESHTPLFLTALEKIRETLSRKERQTRQAKRKARRVLRKLRG